MAAMGTAKSKQVPITSKEAEGGILGADGFNWGILREWEGGASVVVIGMVIGVEMVGDQWECGVMMVNVTRSRLFRTSATVKLFILYSINWYKIKGYLIKTNSPQKRASIHCTPTPIPHSDPFNVH